MSHPQRSFYEICSHVGYTTVHSRLETCPGQSAQRQLSRFVTWPGQSARSSHSRFVTCPGQCAHHFRSRQAACSEQGARRVQQRLPSNCPGQQTSTMAQSRERSASMESDLAEIDFWTFSIGCKNLRQCVRDAPSSTRSFDVSQSDWWKEPGLSQRREALRELTTCEVTHVVDTRCLRDTEGSASRHLGTNLVNVRGMCHNVNMKGLIKDIWTCSEELLREAYKLSKPRARVDVALGFVCNSGRHRSVCISEMTTAVLARLGFFVDLEHMCSPDWGHLCKGACPWFVPTELPWAEWFDWFYVEMMKCAQRRACQDEVWWDYFNLPNIRELPRAVLPPIPDNRPGSRPPPPDIPQESRGSQGARGEPKEKQRAKSGGSSKARAGSACRPFCAAEQFQTKSH